MRWISPEIIAELCDFEYERYDRAVIFRLIFATVLLGAALCANAEDPAQPAGGDAVVISATRVPQPSLEIPASVDRIYAEELREMRWQVNLSEPLARVPGIVVQNRQNYAQDLQISSRGFGARAAFGVRGIRLVADGIPATMADGQGQAATFALGSAERIEVLRGPFSSLYGNASGGVISVITEDGPAQPSAALEVTAGSYGSLRTGVRLGGTEGRINWTVDQSRFDTDGYRDHSAARRDQLNAKVKVSLGEATSLTLLANTLRQPQTQDPLGLSRAQFEANPRQVDATAISFNTRKSIFQEQSGASLSHALEGGGQVQAMLYLGQRYVEQYQAIPLAVQAAATHSGAVVNLDRGYGGGALRWSAPLQLMGRPLRLSAGLEHDRMAERRRGFLNLSGQAGAPKRDEDDTVRSTDAYVQAEWRPAEAWIAHAGLRASSVRFVSADHFIAAGNPDDSGRQSFSATTPVAGVVYRLAPTTSLYANLGRGFETPTFAELSYRPVGTGLNFDLRPSRSRHLEAGIKAILPGRARVNAAVFDVSTRDEIVVDTAAGGRTTFRNAGRTRRDGIELSGEKQFDAGFDAQFAYTRLSATYRDAFAAAPVAVAAGNRMPGVPDMQLYAQLRWRHAPSGFVAAFDVQRRGRVAANDANAEFANAYTVANLALGFNQRGLRWKLSEFLRVDNLSDRNYAGSVIVNDANNRFYESAPRRNMALGVQAALEF
ncbi:MAG: TonB-dependent receptor [Betaproteobacteria bacterium]|nr:TonB-dependent receptor [Betaproteobacteria bacterium]